MSIKKSVRWFIVVGFLVLLLATPKPALALSACGGSYVAEAGETLQSIADRCGTSVEAIRQANPNLGNWINPGQTLWLPGAYQGGSNSYGYQNNSNCYGYQNNSNCYGYQDGGNNYGSQDGGNYYGSQNGGNAYASYGAPGAGTYVVQQGDTMRIIADRLGISLSALIAANPQIWNPSLIYPGQPIYLPSYNAQAAYYNPQPSYYNPQPSYYNPQPSYYNPQPSYYNPQPSYYNAQPSYYNAQPSYYNAQPSYYNAQPSYYPRDFRDGHRYHQESSTTLYTIQHQDTLKSIAEQYDTTVESILALNPTIKKPGRIHAGQVIQVR